MNADHLTGWCAGIIDGEGCFSVAITRHQNGHNYLRPIIVVAMCDPLAIDRLCDVFPAACRMIGKAKQANHRPTFIFRVTGSAACFDVINLVEPFLITKRKVAAVFRDLCNFQRDHGSSDSRLSAADRAERQRLVDLIHECNRRGSSTADLYPNLQILRQAEVDEVAPK